MRFGTGTTYFATMCGALCTAHRRLQDQSILSSATHGGFRVAEDLCVDVIRSLCVPITHIFARNGDKCNTTGHRQRCHGQHSRMTSSTHELTGTVETSHHSDNLTSLAGLTAGLQHGVLDARDMVAGRKVGRGYYGIWQGIDVLRRHMTANKNQIPPATYLRPTTVV